MIRILGTIFAGLLGLAFGSFLNVCLSRWPAGESIVAPRSHCRQCGRALAWWENIPLVSWLALRGRCRSCRAWIGLRYPLVELAVALLWISPVSTLFQGIQHIYYEHFWWGPPITQIFICELLLVEISWMFFYWLLVALAVLDAENFWLPNSLTIPGIGIGLVLSLANEQFGIQFGSRPPLLHGLLWGIINVIAATGLILLIRWVYWLIRHREGIGLGDAKLMALLAAWLGLPGALLAFGMGVVLGSVTAIVLLVIPSARRDSESWAMSKLPLGTFLCIGGIVSSLWGQPILAAYYRWAGF
jgi:leader peptidase (prepilin peptidase)/N-methyltransferase